MSIERQIHTKANYTHAIVMKHEVYEKEMLYAGMRACFTTRFILLHFQYSHTVCLPSSYFQNHHHAEIVFQLSETCVQSSPSDFIDKLH